MKLCHLKFKGQRHTALADALNTARILNKVHSTNLNINDLIGSYEFIYAYIGYLGNLLFIRFQLIFNDQNKCFAHIVILSQDEDLGDLIMNRIYS